MRNLILSVLVLAAGPAFAVPVQWAFQDVVFDDGATLSGSFIFDEDSDTVILLADSWVQPFYSDIEINTGYPNNGEPENLDNAFFYAETGSFDGWVGTGQYGESLDYSANPQPEPYGAPLTVQNGLILDMVQYSSICALAIGGYCDRYLRLDFDSPLTNAGGVINLSGEEFVDWTDGVNYASNTRSIVSGTLVGSAAVPIPAAAWLFGSALVGLGFLRRRIVAP